jgi:hypothetical protein
VLVRAIRKRRPFPTNASNLAAVAFDTRALPTHFLAATVAALP